MGNKRTVKIESLVCGEKKGAPHVYLIYQSYYHFLYSINNTVRRYGT